MTNLLLVPIHLDALYLPNGMSVAEATADFSRLPYFQGRDHNPDTVNLSESILTQAFQNKNLYLKPGIHLHWALPDALTKEGKKTKERENNFSTVPNRWLVRRKSENGDKTWIVESDYLFLPDAGYQEDSVTYPDFQASEGGLRFRYLGRKVLLDNWPIKDDKPQYLDRLTAVGYGEPTFAAFYPNCRSVFGFHDADAKPEDKPQYDVIGWYSDSTKSYLTEFIKDFKNEFKQEFNKDATNDELLQAIKQEFKWDGVTLNQAQVSPEIVCYARLTFNTSSPSQPYTEDIKISLAVANTGTEALSAYLATTIDTNKKKLIENQLEALQLVETLSGQALDIGAKFEELRHESGFNAVSSGTIWTTISSGKKTPFYSQEKTSQSNINPACEWKLILAELNLNQQEYDLLVAEIKSRRRQLFSDWYKYMVCVYPPEHSWDNYPNIDQVKYYIENKGIQALKLKGDELKQLQLKKDNSENQMVLDLVNSGSLDIATEINGLIDITNNVVIEIIDNAVNQKAYYYFLITVLTRTKIKSLTVYLVWINFLHHRLETVASPRYWEPREPVVLITGKDKAGEDTNKNAIKASERHGQDGRLNKDGFLECQIVQSDKTIANLVKELEDKNITKKSEEFKIVFDEINSLYKKNPKAIGFSEWNQQPWYPFLLQWLVEIFPVSQSGNKSSANRNYVKDFIARNYQLGEQAVDLAPNKETNQEANKDQEANKENDESIDKTSNSNHIPTDRDSNVYSGFSILTPYANTLLQKRILEFLETYHAEFLEPDLAKFLEIYMKLCTYKEKNKEKKDKNNQTELHELAEELRQNISVNYPKYQELKESSSEYLIKNIKEIIIWYKKNLLILIATKSQEILKDFQCLSQSLGGFNEALLMRKQTLQLMIDDPIGFEDYQRFTEQVRDLVDDEVRSAPQPLDDFNPIRAGEMRIISLELIDTFGQVRNLNWDEQIIKPEAMKTKEESRVVLSPRLVQPCRINFRWLDANDTNNQVTDAETTPICGWILPNNLNSSLMIYDNKGVALGSIINNNSEDPDKNKSNWCLAPGNNHVTVDKINNLYLKKLVEKILSLIKAEDNFLENFLACLNNALENIDPENFAQHESIALLMGRPIAVVRASVNLELQGLPAINQDWNVFRKEMQQNLPMEKRDTDNFVNVQFPIRIGEFKQFNDGVIGYWKEDAQGEYEGNIFYSQQSDSTEFQYIETQKKNPDINPTVKEGSEDDKLSISILQSINSPAQILTMLVDPRCVFHATSGILPSKVINIPPEQYTEALKNIKVTFLTAPILTDKDQLHLPLLSEPGYDWSWLEKKGSIWSEITMIPMVEKATFITIFTARFPDRESSSETCWNELLAKKWLKNIENTHSQSVENTPPLKAEIIAKDKREKLSDFQDLKDAIDEILDLHHIVIEPASTRANFGSSQGIREGWLVLSKNTQQNEV